MSTSASVGGLVVHPARFHPPPADPAAHTAALLSHRRGFANVTSVEIDESLAKQAATNLAQLGYAPRLVVGDGADGRPDRGPYDRVHVTCGVTTIPYAWVEQTVPAG